jgi:uncharacterized protein
MEIRAMADPGSNPISVEVAYATPKKQLIVEVRAAAGLTAGQAIALSGIRTHFPEIADEPAIGIFSRKVPMDQVLRAGDRVEIYRPLLADPKEARRKKAELEKRRK